MSRTYRVWVAMLILAIATLYGGVVLALSPYHGFWSGDAGVKLWQMEAWIANGWRTPWFSCPDVNIPLDPDHRLSPLEPPFAVWKEVATRWQLLADTAIGVPTLPPLVVADYVPREP